MEALIDKSITYHCRKGLRTWCDCSYCTTKIIGTRRIQNAGMAGFWPSNGLDHWEVWTELQRYRETLATALRKKLVEVKEEGITT